MPRSKMTYSYERHPRRNLSLTVTSHERWNVPNHDLKSSDGCLFGSSFRQTTKKASKFCITGILLRESNQQPVISPHKWPMMRKVFPYPLRLRPINWRLKDLPPKWTLDFSKIVVDPTPDSQSWVAISTLAASPGEIDRVTAYII